MTPRTYLRHQAVAALIICAGTIGLVPLLDWLAASPGWLASGPSRGGFGPYSRAPAFLVLMSGWVAVTSAALSRPGRPDSTLLAVACASYAYVLQSAALTTATRDVYLYTLFARQFTTLPLIALVVALARGSLPRLSLPALAASYACLAAVPVAWFFRLGASTQWAAWAAVVATLLATMPSGAVVRASRANPLLPLVAAVGMVPHYGHWLTGPLWEFIAPHLVGPERAVFGLAGLDTTVALFRDHQYGATLAVRTDRWLFHLVGECMNAWQQLVVVAVACAVFVVHHDRHHAARAAGLLLATGLLAINALNHWRFARTFDFAHTCLAARDEAGCAAPIGDFHLADGFTFAVVNAWVVLGLTASAGWWLRGQPVTERGRRGGG